MLDELRSLDSFEEREKGFLKYVHRNARGPGGTDNHSGLASNVAEDNFIVGSHGAAASTAERRRTGDVGGWIKGKDRSLDRRLGDPRREQRHARSHPDHQGLGRRRGKDAGEDLRRGLVGRAGGKPAPGGKLSPVGNTVDAKTATVSGAIRPLGGPRTRSLTLSSETRFSMIRIEGSPDSSGGVDTETRRFQHA